jgi:hypothetical protein
MSERPPDDRRPRSVDDLGEPEPFEVIDRRGRYILGAAEDYYGVWDTRGADRYLERFPLTEEGFQAAERRFIELRRLSRRQRGVFPRALWIALLVGVGIWVVTGLGVVVLTVWPRAAVDNLYEVLYVLDSLGFRVALGVLFLAAGVVILRGERATRRPEPPGTGGVRVSGPAEASGRSAAVDRILATVLTVGLLVWVGGTVAVELFREPNPVVSGFPVVVGAGDRPHFVAVFAQELAFRAWVAAFVLLLIRWARSRGVLVAEPDDRG